jgi:hypothetical protein
LYQKINTQENAQVLITWQIFFHLLHCTKTTHFTYYTTTILKISKGIFLINSPEQGFNQKPLVLLQKYHQGVVTRDILFKKKDEDGFLITPGNSFQVSESEVLVFHTN